MTPTQVLQIPAKNLLYKNIKKYCILHGKCSHTIGNRKDLKALVSKQKQKKEKIQPYAQGKNELNALIEKKCKKSKEQEKEED